MKRRRRQKHLVLNDEELDMIIQSLELYDTCEDDYGIKYKLNEPSFMSDMKNELLDKLKKILA
jgi:hypothetical protein